MRPYNRWLFHEHFELVITISKLYAQLPVPNLLEILNLHFSKPSPPPDLNTSLNRPPWSKYDIDSLSEDFRLLFLHSINRTSDEQQSSDNNY
ncbi:hypothetical protein Desac_1052 [Desulfobacca acetoxidans DSM 11109]|uniref:Uncharacterized protein n=1 Tax=Desulfobacca acetoxidans (strain ATCC 700848 / DSM 11109 / ASRB2) TaxID=880072 RepID=F2NH74_DESAR|nr:hypothetical protein Desac_1052 [Desulfobacca acetoxidans DSM 11109]HAY22242.1 hypothetical protein [Desulfobacterales bacterium]